MSDRRAAGQVAAALFLFATLLTARPALGQDATGGDATAGDDEAAAQLEGLARDDRADDGSAAPGQAVGVDPATATGAPSDRIPAPEPGLVVEPASIVESWWLWTAVSLVVLGVVTAVIVDVTTDDPAPSAPRPMGLTVARY